MMHNQIKSLGAESCQSFECQWLLRNAVSYEVPLHYCPTLDYCASEIESILLSHSKTHLALLSRPVQTFHNASQNSQNSSELSVSTVVKTLGEGVLQLELSNVWAPVRAPVAMSKNVWILWLQGWDQAPWLVQQVANSWESYNPGWTVVRLDNTSLAMHIDTLLPNDIPAPAHSDLIRLALMKEHGGVWADATMLCMQSLDSWVPAALQPSGFWMFHGWGGGIQSCGGAASWFMVSEPESAIAAAWLKSSLIYWEGRKDFDNYFW